MNQLSITSYMAVTVTSAIVNESAVNNVIDPSKLQDDISYDCDYFIVSSYSSSAECAEDILALLKPLLQCLRIQNDTIHTQCILCIAALNRQYNSLISVAFPSSRDRNRNLKLVEMACTSKINADADDDDDDIDETGLVQVITS